MKNLLFYEIDEAYLSYLNQFDNKVTITNNSNYKYNKFFCGIILNINDLNYFVPVSSFKKQQQTNFLIIDKNRPISSLRLSFMIPVKDGFYKPANFLNFDTKYQDLVKAEIKFCNQNKSDIYNKALEVYNKALKNKFFSKLCCNFKLLEEKCLEYK